MQVPVHIWLKSPCLLEQMINVSRPYLYVFIIAKKSSFDLGKWLEGLSSSIKNSRWVGLLLLDRSRRLPDPDLNTATAYFWILILGLVSSISKTVVQWVWFCIVTSEVTLFCPRGRRFDDSLFELCKGCGVTMASDCWVSWNHRIGRQEQAKSSLESGASWWLA